ncbi:hypothetical protein [Parapedobacter sp. 10938]|uniref:hypothetical protein n=1 Tax=Parapedobacter flavus TaxID=3110225 RepID=UPI002DBD7799|nr:hypothetical protein [Parapedobacter sp. 10938]MEC3878313.1 hypothetical protein [Parapedobacter sp. 10938]
MNRLTLALLFVGMTPFVTGLKDGGMSVSTGEGQFLEHGVASPFSNDRGIVATVDGDGRNIVMLWLFDRRGGYGLLVIDAATGKSETFPMPFDVGGDAPYSSLFSSQGKLYTLFNGNFVEFDPKKRAFTFSHKTAPRMAMGMTEDDQGRIWSVTYPNSGVVCYDPKTGELTDYGHVHKENWAQYQRYVATDDRGWVYFAVGNTDSHIIALNPETKAVTPLLQPTERKRGMAYVYRDNNGKVYGKALGNQDEPWYELYQGTIKLIGHGHTVDEKEIITGSQALRVLAFPNGQRVGGIDLVNRKLTITNPGGKEDQTVAIDYDTEGTWVMGIAASPDKKSIIGGSAFPMRLLEYAVATGEWGHDAAYGQYNALTTHGKYAFFASYPRGDLIVWDTEKPYTGAKRGDPHANPRLLVSCSPVIHRPHRVLAHPDGKTVIMGGTPDYGYTGGGLLFYDLDTDEHVLMTDNELVPNQSVMSLTVLDDGKILVGTTTAPGTGGEKKANLARLYIIDKDSKEVEWQSAVIAGAQTYTDLTTRADGKVYGFVNGKIFFVFDPASKNVIYQKDISHEFGRTVAEQSPRVFVKGQGENTYILFHQAIAQVDHQSYAINEIARPPLPIRAGGGFLNNRIYYISDSRLYSYGL